MCNISNIVCSDTWQVPHLYGKIQVILSFFTKKVLQKSDHTTPLFIFLKNKSNNPNFVQCDTKSFNIVYITSPNIFLHNGSKLGCLDNVYLTLLMGVFVAVFREYFNSLLLKTISLLAYCSVGPSCCRQPRDKTDQCCTSIIGGGIVDHTNRSFIVGERVFCIFRRCLKKITKTCCEVIGTNPRQCKFVW